MGRTDFTRMRCPVARSMAVLGERWAMLVLREAFYGTTRFDEFERHLGIAPNILSARLRDLTAHGLLEKVPLPSRGRRRPARIPADREGPRLLPRLSRAEGLGRSLDGRAGRPPGAAGGRRHRPPGQAPPALSAAGTPLRPEDVRILPGPGAGEAMRARFDRRSRPWLMAPPPRPSSPSVPSPAAPRLPVLMRRVLTLAAPTTLVAAVQCACQLVEPWLAARQGTASLAGWAVVLPFALLLQQMSTGAMGGGVVSAIARALGAKRQEEAAALVIHALVIALGFGLVYAVLLAGFPRQILGADRRAGSGRRRRRLLRLAVRRRRHPGLAGEYPGLGAARRRAACAGLPRAAARLARLPAAGLGADGTGGARLAGAGIAFAVMMTAATSAWRWWCWPAAPASARPCG